MLRLGFVTVVLLTSSLGALELTFDFATPGTLTDKNGLGTGFTHRLPGTAAYVTGDDPYLDLLANPGNLTLTSVAPDKSRQHPDQFDPIGFYIPNAGGETLTLTAIFRNIQVPEPSDQLMLFVGSSPLNLLVAGPHNDTGFSIRGNEREYSLSYIDDSGIVSLRVVSEVGAQAYLDGEDVMVTLQRSAGIWTFCWQNLTDPSKSGCLEPVSLPSIDAEPALYVGVYYANPRNTNPKQSLLDYFSVVSYPRVSVPSLASINCDATEVPILIASAEAIGGGSLALDYDPALFELLDVLPGAVFEEVGGADSWDKNLAPPGCPGSTAGATLAFIVANDGSRSIPSGENEIAKLIFRLKATEVPQCNSSPLIFRDVCFGDPPVSLVLSTVAGDDILPDTEDGVLTVGNLCFIRGDANLNGKLTISDAVKIIACRYRDILCPCPDAGDADDDGAMDIADVIYIVSYLFRTGPQPPAPYPSSGPDPTEDLLGCSPCMPEDVE